MIYPDDENGDVLRRMEANGGNLSRSRDIDFSVVFPNEVAAENFSRYFRKAGYKVTVEFAQVKAGHPWDALVVKHMIPSHSAITEFENELQQIASSLDGYNDGWGCITQT